MTLFAADWLSHYRARDRVFGVLSEAQWRVLLDLRHRGRPLSVTSCCIASGAPASTALRHIGELIEAGFIQREPHPTDRRSELLTLSSVAIEGFETLEAAAAPQSSAPSHAVGDTGA